MAAKGIVYSLIGFLAAKAALGIGVEAYDVERKDVFLFIEDLFMGGVLLGLVALGLGFYSLWRWLQAITDTEKKGSSLKGMAYRLRYAGSGLLYGLLAFIAAGLSIGDGSERDRQEVIISVLHKPLGHLVIMSAAATVALAGVYQVYVGLSGRYTRKVREQGLDRKTEDTMIFTGKVGHIARGLVWGILSYLLARMALGLRKTDDSGNAFEFMQGFPYGPYLVGAMALGLLCYSLFIFIEATYRYQDP
ncbi:hypothetical protein ABID22_002224 [Pontibacter aydingkolensis]|uniref:DUF1206 domain-containing protein n=1 Tax=Pontibacter aydingkolensis TaxID=1911536 RepID=A0ABS7CVH8_9BACT|nr:DUF1206 domain-containing protein [Pontibacter aydingkolensis]MBW7467829.1 DUF1206 domain-containing protein [Pontibacter aydingkolensis]